MYVKANLADGVEIKVEITSENVFDVCPQCGKEHSIFLDEWTNLDNDDFSLVEARFFCEECSQKRRRSS